MGDTAAKSARSPVACLHCMYRRGDGSQTLQWHDIRGDEGRWHGMLLAQTLKVIILDISM